jgi:hypothetical protein
MVVWLGDNMKKVIIDMTSIGYKILIIILTVAIFTLDIIFFIYSLPLYGCIFLTCVLMLLLFGCYLFFKNKIIFKPNQKQLKVNAIFVKKLNLEDIYDIKVDVSNSINDKRYCFIVILMKNGQIYKFSGFSSLCKKNSAVKITEEKIKFLKEQMKLIN